MERLIDIQDALISIMLVEESMLILYKTSVLGFKQLNHKRNIDTYSHLDVSIWVWGISGLNEL